MECLKKTVICCRGWDPPLLGFSDCVYSPVLYSLGPGTRLTGRSDIFSPPLPGIDISRFAGGVPISAAAKKLDALAGRYGIMLHGGKFGKVIANSLNCQVFLPEVPEKSTSFEASIDGHSCPVIKPICCIVRFVNSERSVAQIPQSKLRLLIDANKMKIYYSNTHKCMYGSMKVNGGFGFLLFDTAKTVVEKCRFAEKLNKTPVLYYREIRSLIRKPL